MSHSAPPTEGVTSPPENCTNPHADGCSECVYNTEPAATHESVPGGCQCTYVCTDCGHAWSTAWWCG